MRFTTLLVASLALAPLAAQSHDDLREEIRKIVREEIRAALKEMHAPDTADAKKVAARIVESPSLTWVGEGELPAEVKKLVGKDGKGLKIEGQPLTFTWQSDGEVPANIKKATVKQRKELPARLEHGDWKVVQGKPMVVEVKGTDDVAITKKSPMVIVVKKAGDDDGPSVCEVECKVECTTEGGTKTTKSGECCEAAKAAAECCEAAKACEEACEGAKAAEECEAIEVEAKPAKKAKKDKKDGKKKTKKQKEELETVELKIG